MNIPQICFIIGLATGLLASSILFYIIFYEDIKAVKEFNERQEHYRRMI